jgi:transposase InsO family protein
MHLGGVTINPTGTWTVQQARNLALSLDQRFAGIRFLIRDRGSNFTASFDAVFQTAGTRILVTAVQAPRMNAICERLVGTLRRRCQTSTVAGVTVNISPPPASGISRDSAASHSRSAGW